MSFSKFLLLGNPSKIYMHIRGQYHKTFKSENNIKTY